MSKTQKIRKKENKNKSSKYLELIINQILLMQYSWTLDPVEAIISTIIWKDSLKILKVKKYNGNFFRVLINRISNLFICLIFYI